MKKLAVRTLALILTLGMIVGCGPAKPKGISRVSYALNTEIAINLYDSDDQSLIDECLAICNRYEKVFSRTLEGTEIYRLNESGSLDASEDTLELVEKGLEYCSLSDGRFDITIEPVSSLWNFTDEKAEVPQDLAIQAALPFVDYKKVKIDGQTISLEEGMGLDLGAIAKGYIADKVKEYLVSQGVKSAAINLGGNVLLIGQKTDGSDFNIGIRDPQNPSSLKCRVSASDISVVTSGTYERFIEKDGKKYHHILDPETGYSYENGLDSVTILSEFSVDGDALSTTCFALGEEKALELINSLDGIYAILINEDGEITLSDGLQDHYKFEMNKQ